MNTKLLLSKALMWIILITILLTSIIPMISINNLKASDSNTIYRSDTILSNEQIKIFYTDEIAGIGNYTNDTIEPRGWELQPSLYWDGNGNSVFDDNENIAATLFPLAHFTEDTNHYTFCPMHQSIMQDPGDAEITFSGWISEPNIYASEVKDDNNLVTINSTISIYNGNNYFTQTIEIKSTASTTLTNVDLIIYTGIDINGFFDDYAFVDPSNNSMVKAKDNKTGVWFGAYPTDVADNYEISIWDDGPADNEDLWQHCLDNNLNGGNTASDDIEGALQFYLSNLSPGESESITLYYSFGDQESDLYPPPANNPPYTPSSPDPYDGETGVDINHNLSWTGGDPDGDPVTYDVYFGDVSPPPQVEWNQSGTTYDPGIMEYSTTYFWQIVAWDNHGANTAGPIWSFTTEEQPNNPPYAPDIDGPTSGKVGVKYEFRFVTTDPEGEDVYYWIEWGDGDKEEWIGPFKSEQQITLNHTWEEERTYTIKAKAKDIHDAESGWTEFEIVIPRARFTTMNALLLRLLDRFPVLFRIIRYLLLV